MAVLTEEIPSRVKFIDRARRRIEIEMNDVSLQFPLNAIPDPLYLAMATAFDGDENPDCKLLAAYHDTVMKPALTTSDPSSIFRFATATKIVRLTLTDDEIAEHYVTYTAGLFRSIRFGIEEAHGMANLIQLNFLTQNKVISFDYQRNQYLVDMNLFPKVVKELAKRLLMIEAHGNYEEAVRFIESYGKMSTQTSESVDRLVNIPTDLDLNFIPDL